eukprot:3000586-Prymnesium_polylepis.1
MGDVLTRNLFTLFVLSVRGKAGSRSRRFRLEDELSAQLQADYLEPPNPVRYALELSQKCSSRARFFTRDRRMADKLRAAANVMDLVACGLIEAANQAAEQAHAPGQFNLWKPGNKDSGNKYYEPRVVTHLWVTGALEFAAKSGMRNFSSHPVVYSHLREVFMLVSSSRAPDTSMSAQDAPRQYPCLGAAIEMLKSARFYALVAIVNAATLPLVPIVPQTVVDVILLQQGATQGRSRRVMIFWITPIGSFMLWASSQLVLAVLLTGSQLTFLEFGVVDG